MAELAADRPEPGRGAVSSRAPGLNSEVLGGDLDRLIHERTRLGIVSALAANGRMSFVELRTALKATDGNISSHARRLEEGGYIEASKRFEDRMPRTEYELTEAGRDALEGYLAHMERLIRSVRRP